MSDTVPAEEPKLLGPFLGYVTPHSIRIWLHLEGLTNTIFISIHPEEYTAPAVAFGTLNLRADKLFTDCTTIGDLCPDTKYFYQLWTNPARSLPLNLQGLTEKDLHFRTLSADANDQIDFLMMSCHNPTVAE